MLNREAITPGGLPQRQQQGSISGGGGLDHGLTALAL